MTLVRFQPYGLGRVYYRYQKPVNETEKSESKNSNCYCPRTDIAEDSGSFKFYVELHGLNKDDIKVSVGEERILTIKGEKKKQEFGENAGLVRAERAYGSFERSFALPENAGYEKIEAKYENGVLELSIPKLEPAKPKEFEISIN
jgi:HSP20 family protein